MTEDNCRWERVAIIADVHGNDQALDAVLRDISLLGGVDRIISLGDNVGYGPEPEEVVQRLREADVLSVMGNHELALQNRRYFYRLNYVARESLELTRSLLSQESLDWLASLPPVLCRGGARFVHGCPPDSMTVYLLNPTENRLRRLFTTYEEQFCFAGHTHDFGWYQLDGPEIRQQEIQLGVRVQLDPQSRYLILPGSVGQPRDTLGWSAKYLLWDLHRGTAELRAVEYDVLATIRLINERGFPAVNGQRLFR